MAFRFTFQVSPDTAQFDRVLKLRYGGMFETKPALEEIATEIVYPEIRRNFATAGSVAGGWLPLSPGYARQKARDFKAGRIRFSKLMFRSGALAASLSGPNGAKAIYRVTDNALEIGTEIEYAQAHNVGTDSLPQRRLVALSEDARRRIVRVFQAADVATGRRGGRLF